MPPQRKQLHLLKALRKSNTINQQLKYNNDPEFNIPEDLLAWVDVDYNPIEEPTSSISDSQYLSDFDETEEELEYTIMEDEERDEIYLPELVREGNLWQQMKRAQSITPGGGRFRYSHSYQPTKRSQQRIAAHKRDLQKAAAGCRPLTQSFLIKTAFVAISGSSQEQAISIQSEEDAGMGQDENGGLEGESGVWGERVECGGNLDSQELAIRAEEVMDEEESEGENSSIRLDKKAGSERGEVISYESPEEIRAKDLQLAILDLEKKFMQRVLT